jgi:hypothetical protein
LVLRVDLEDGRRSLVSDDIGSGGNCVFHSSFLFSKAVVLEESARYTPHLYSRVALETYVPCAKINMQPSSKYAYPALQQLQNWLFANYSSCFDMHLAPQASPIRSASY